jgi:hypothetical protein
MAAQPPPAGCWPGGVDTYFDLYVAGAWNVFRSAWLLLCALNLGLSKILGPDDNDMNRMLTAGGLVEDMIASIPYHLVDNLQLFLAEVEEIGEITDHGKTLGGLLLLHPLYIAANLSFVAEDMREYMRTCLRWIGSDMGFGQATFLAEVRPHKLWIVNLAYENEQNSNVERDYLASGWMIIWSGFLM